MISDVIATYFDRWTGYAIPVRTRRVFKDIRDLTLDDYRLIMATALDMVDPVEVSYWFTPDPGLRAALERAIWSLDDGQYFHKIDAPTFDILLKELTARYHRGETTSSGVTITAKPKKKTKTKKGPRIDPKLNRELRWIMFDLPPDTVIVQTTKKALLLDIPLGKEEGNAQFWIPKSVIRERQDSRGRFHIAPWWWIRENKLERLFEKNILRSV